MRPLLEEAKKREERSAPKLPDASMPAGRLYFVCDSRYDIAVYCWDVPGVRPARGNGRDAGWLVRPRQRVHAQDATHRERYARRLRWNDRDGLDDRAGLHVPHLAPFWPTCR